MKDDPVPDLHHIARYCGGSTIRENGSISGVAFRLRQTEEFLSVNWLEFLSQPTRDAEIREIRKVLGSKLQLGAKARIAALNTGELRRYVGVNSPDGRELRVLHEPEPGDPSYSGIFNLLPEHDLIADLLAGVIQATYPAKG